MNGFFVLISLMFVQISHSQIISLSFTGGDVGTILTTINNLLGFLQWGIRQSVEMETNLTSVERLIQYANLQPEKSVIESDDEESENENQNGQIQFENVYFQYYKEGPFVLENLSFKIHSGEKIGVVGRTGAGKSSLISAIFRMANISSGKIKINGKNTAKTELYELRNSLSIIPQSPTIITGVMRVLREQYFLELISILH